jgi:prepilin-type N-terminal cleavage/methylation domain-containing protein
LTFCITRVTCPQPQIEAQKRETSMSTDGHGIKATAGRPQVRWTVLRPAPSPCPSVLVERPISFSCMGGNHERIDRAAILPLLLRRRGQGRGGRLTSLAWMHRDHGSGQRVAPVQAGSLRYGSAELCATIHNEPIGASSPRPSPPKEEREIPSPHAVGRGVRFAFTFDAAYSQPRRQSTRGFSLIEMIGVLAIVAILATAMAPVFVKRVDRDVWNQEVSDLNVISNALLMQILRSNNIPSETSWTALLTNWLTRPASLVSMNSRGNARLFLYEQGGWLNAYLPWTQFPSTVLSPVPTNARIALVASIGRPLPNANGPIATADFNSIWNAAQGTVPSYLAGLGWNGTADDLVIQRVSLDQMFHHLVLTTRDSPSSARYSINTSSTSLPLPSPDWRGLDSYYLHGTTVGLWDANGLTNRFLLVGDTSFTFDGGMWQSQLTGGSADNSGIATNFAAAAAAFVATPLVGKSGSTAQSVLSAFYGFMYGYTVWANECPHFQAPANPIQQTDYQFLSVLGQQSSGIIDSTAGQNGLLK